MLVIPFDVILNPWTLIRLYAMNLPLEPHPGAFLRGKTKMKRYTILYELFAKKILLYGFGYFPVKVALFFRSEDS